MLYRRVNGQWDSCPLWRASGAYARLSTFTPGGADGDRDAKNLNRQSHAAALLKAFSPLDERDGKVEFHVISEGTPLITWREIRRIWASFPTNAQKLYRLKCNSFLICNWASQDRSCPVPECATAGSAMARHIFWTRPSARRQWKYLLDRWRWLGALPMADMND